MRSFALSRRANAQASFIPDLDDERVEVLAASDLELDVVGVLLDLHGLGVLASRRQQELLDLGDLLRHDERRTTDDERPNPVERTSSWNAEETGLKLFTHDQKTRNHTYFYVLNRIR